MDSQYEITSTCSKVDHLIWTQPQSRDELLVWQRYVFKTFNSKILKGYPSALSKRLSNSLVTAFINLINGMSYQKVIDELFDFITKRIDVSTKELIDVFQKTNLEPITSRSFKLTWVALRRKARLTVIYNDNPENCIKIVIPGKRAEKIADFTEHLITLVENYHFICVESSFFWSIHPDVYSALNVEEKEVIEGFASPYNNNIEKYCSLFVDDIRFGSIGNFFTVIEEHKIKTRWILNPPYTNFMIDQMTAAVKKRINDFPDDEFFFLLPNWSDLEIINLISDNGLGRRLARNEYKLYDHINEEVISPPVDMFFGFMKGSKLTPYDMINFEQIIKLF